MKQFYILLLLLILTTAMHAQITEFPYNEGFEEMDFPPSGWISYPIVPGDMEFVRVSEGEWPDCLPHDGSLAMAQYNSFNASIGEEAVLISPEMMLSEDNVLRFWFFRSEDPSNNRYDKIEVYYNTNPDLEGAVFMDSINRAINFYPEVNVEAWYQYEFEFNSPGSTYIIFKAISAYGWKMYLDDVEVSTSTIDVDPPTVISLDGTQAYAQQTMNLELVVRDVSDMPETLEGEVTINGGIWILEMTKTNGTQGDYTYKGSISGQNDHTEGEVRFWLIDALENAAWSDYYALHWDWVQPILEEGFEGEAFPPEGWTVIGQPLTWLTWDDYGLVYYTDSDGVDWEVYPPQGERQAAVEWDFQGNDQNEWLISPEINITENAVLTFKTFVRLNSYDYDEYLVRVSTDGFNWENLWSASDYPAGVSNYEEDIALSLDAYVGEDVRIAWQAYNLLGTNLWYSWFVDDIKIRATDTIVGIGEKPPLENVKAFPNPFSTFTKIRVQLQHQDDVTLKVFRNDGTLVFEQTSKGLSAGFREFTIKGASLTPGFYFYELRTKAELYTGKLIRK